MVVTDGRDLLMQMAEIPAQQLSLEKELPPINLMQGIEVLEGSTLHFISLTKNGTTLPVHTPKEFTLPQHPANYEVHLKIQKGERTKEITRTFSIEKANTTPITDYPLGSLAEVSREYNAWDKYNDLY